MDNKDLQNFLKQRRVEMGLTLKEVSQKVGVSEGTISRWESGDIENMRRDKIVAYAKALDISPAVIMGWDEANDIKKPVYYLDPETAKVAQEIHDNHDLKVLFDAARTASPEDLRTTHQMLMALKRKERGGGEYD